MLKDFCESHEEYVAWRHTITHTHERRIRVRVLNLDHKRLAWIDNVLDGQITIDVTNRECTRVANLRLLDPTRSIGYEPDSPSSLPLHLRRMIQVFYEVAVPGYGWVSCPVFCGPVSEMDREGAEVSIVAESKERLALGSFGRSHTWAKRRKITEVIREILTLAGEAPTRIHVPNLSRTLPKELNVSRIDQPWVVARRLARDLDYELFYDARGHARMRKQPTTPSLTLNSDFLTGPVRIDRPKVEFNNGWIILGAKPAGAKTRVTSGLVGLPKRNDFSAYQLRRSGEWRWQIHQEERTSVKTNAAAHAIAVRMRDEAIRATAEISLDCLPFPNVEEWDLLRARDPLTGASLTRVRQATIPLVGGAQTIGAIRRISRGKRHGGFQPAQTGGI